jgi:hypothetical protein
MVVTIIVIVARLGFLALLCVRGWEMKQIDGQS